MEQQKLLELLPEGRELANLMPRQEQGTITSENILASTSFLSTSSNLDIIMQRLPASPQGAAR